MVTREADPAAQPELRPQHRQRVARVHRPLVRRRVALLGPVQRLHDRHRLARRPHHRRPRRAVATRTTCSGTRRTRASSPSSTTGTPRWRWSRLRAGITDINIDEAEGPRRSSATSCSTCSRRRSRRSPSRCTTTCPPASSTWPRCGRATSSTRSTTCPRASVRRCWRTGTRRTAPGMVDNDLMVVLAQGKNPVLAHLFLDFMLDTKNALDNFGYIGYQPPQTSLDAASMVADGYVPENLGTAIVKQEWFDPGLPAARAAARDRRGVAPGLAAVQGRRLTRDGAAHRAREDRDDGRAGPGRSAAQPLPVAGAGPARHGLAAAAVRRAAVRRAGHRLRRRRPDLPDAGPGVEPGRVEHRAVQRRLPAHLRRRRLSSARRWSAPRSTCSPRARCACSSPTRWPTTSPATADGGASCVLALLIAPFWISYMMRMLAWVNLLQNDGLVNRSSAARRLRTRSPSTGWTAEGSS